MLERSRLSPGRLLLGFGVIAGGVLLALDNLGVAGAHDALLWWPVVLIAYGLACLLGIGRCRAWMWGSLVTLAGTWLLLHNLGVVRREVWALWPVVFVLLGVAILTGGVRRVYRVGYVGPRPRDFHGPRVYGWVVRRPNRWGAPGSTAASASGGPGPEAAGGPGGGAGGGVAGAAGEAARSPWGAAGAPGEPASAPGGAPGASEEAGAARPREPYDPATTFKIDMVMASISRRITLQQLKRGEITAVLGGGDIDLRGARMATDTAWLEVNLVMGGVNLFIPEDWAVEFLGTPIMGGVDDQSRHPAGEPRGRLMVTGTTFLGGMVIKN